MRVLDLYEEGKLRPDANYRLLAHMHFPDDDISAEQFVAVTRLEMKRRRRDANAPQGDIMGVVEGELLRNESLGRMAGDVALKMVNERARGGHPSLEYAASFVSEYYTSEETPSYRYPTDVARLQKNVRRFKNSLHYWAAWQCCQTVDGLDFVRNPGNLWQLLIVAGLVQIALTKLKYFADCDPWCVPIEIFQKIDQKDLFHRAPEPSEFERAFEVSYRNKIGR